MVPPTLFVSGGVAVLSLCQQVYTSYQKVKRFREDCRKLAHFVQRIEAFITETEDDADMSEPGWQAAFSALHESLMEVVEVFDRCATYGTVRSIINADTMNLRLCRIAQRLMLALQLIPVQKAKATQRRMAEMSEIQLEIRSATFAAARAAEQQAAQLKRLIDQSKVDHSKTQDMLAQVLVLLQSDPTTRPAAAAAGSWPGGETGAPPPGQQQQQQQQCLPSMLTVDLAQLDAEVLDLQAGKQEAHADKNILEEQYMEQIIAAITAMEESLQQQQHQSVPEPDEVPINLRCPITFQLLRDPVLLLESHQTYEREAIEEWLGRGNMKDPITGIQVTSTMLVPNVLVKKCAQEWADAHPNYSKHKSQEEPIFDAAKYHNSSSGGSIWSSDKGAAAAAAAAAASAFAAKCQITAKQPDPKQQLDPLEALVEQDEQNFSINPKTAAVLAAAYAARLAVGSGSSGGNAMFVQALQNGDHSSKKHLQPQQQQQEQDWVQSQESVDDITFQKQQAAQSACPAAPAASSKPSVPDTALQQQAAHTATCAAEEPAAVPDGKRNTLDIQDLTSAASAASAAAFAAAAGGRKASSSSLSDMGSAPTSRQPSALDRSNRGSFFKRLGLGRDSVSSQCDDTASISSAGSSSSQRSKSKSVLGSALKNLKYSMVYHDDKC